jgi:hypothetical protein
VELQRMRHRSLYRLTLEEGIAGWGGGWVFVPRHGSTNPRSAKSARLQVLPASLTKRESNPKIATDRVRIKIINRKRQGIQAKTKERPGLAETLFRRG